jgi:hypothetical protein
MTTWANELNANPGESWDSVRNRAIRRIRRLVDAGQAKRAQEVIRALGRAKRSYDAGKKPPLQKQYAFKKAPEFNWF